MLRLTLPTLVGLPEDELHARQALHRGVYCRSGALVPTDTTLFHLCPAQHFNVCLPLDAKRVYRCPGHTEEEGVLCFRDTTTLCAYGNLMHVAKGDTTCFYVLQLEIDLLTGRVLPSSDDTNGPGNGQLGHSMYRVLGPGINEEAISRVWLAKRDSCGAFLTCDPPTGARHRALHDCVFVDRSSEPPVDVHTGRRGE